MPKKEKGKIFFHTQSHPFFYIFILDMKILYFKNIHILTHKSRYKKNKLKILNVRESKFLEKIHALHNSILLIKENFKFRFITTAQCKLILKKGYHFGL